MKSDLSLHVFLIFFVIPTSGIPSCTFHNFSASHLRKAQCSILLWLVNFHIEIYLAAYRNNNFASSQKDADYRNWNCLCVQFESFRMLCVQEVTVIFTINNFLSFRHESSAATRRIQKDKIILHYSWNRDISGCVVYVVDHCTSLLPKEGQIRC